MVHNKAGGFHAALVPQGLPGHRRRRSMSPFMATAVRSRPARWPPASLCRRGIWSRCSRRWCARASSRARAVRAAAMRSGASAAASPPTTFCAPPAGLPRRTATRTAAPRPCSSGSSAGHGPGGAGLLRRALHASPSKTWPGAPSSSASPSPNPPDGPRSTRIFTAPPDTRSACIWHRSRSGLLRGGIPFRVKSPSIRGRRVDSARLRRGRGAWRGPPEARRGRLWAGSCTARPSRLAIGGVRPCRGRARRPPARKSCPRVDVTAALTMGRCGALALVLGILLFTVTTAWRWCGCAVAARRPRPGCATGWRACMPRPIASMRCCWPNRRSWCPGPPPATSPTSSATSRSSPTRRRRCGCWRSEAGSSPRRRRRWSARSMRCAPAAMPSRCRLSRGRGRTVEANGRAIGGRAVLRLRDVSGLKRELAEPQRPPRTAQRARWNCCAG